MTTHDEWQALISAIGGTDNEGNLKEAGTAHWLSPNTGATNLTCFSALPGGMCYNSTTFKDMGKKAYFWSSSEFTNPDLIYMISLNYDDNIIGEWSYMKSYAIISVRCIRDQ